MGWLSEYFNVECGVRQGCPFSPQAFVLALELLAIRLRANANIKGIHLPFKVNADQSVKVLLYADDVTLLVQDLQDLKNALTLVTYFSKFSGLAMNRLKSEAMWLGSMKYCEQHPFGLIWKQSIKILGVVFHNNVTASNNEENWIPRIKKFEQIISSWY
jgi:hypothetical protein